MRTGRKKFTNVALSAADVAVHMNHFTPDEDASNVMKMKHETYSGVDVDAMEKVERERSSIDPSYMPDRTPIKRADGTMRTITQNISLPVSARRVAVTSPTSALNTVDTPQSP